MAPCSIRSPGPSLPDQTVVIEGPQIRAITGPDVAPPPSARVVDCQGKFMLPGLIDAHVHLVHLANRSHVTGDQFLPMFLANGVTSVRDAGDEIVAQSIIARSAELRPELCPRVFLTSPLIDTDPPLHRDVGYALTDPAKVRAFVDDMLQWQVTTLKIYAGTSRPVGREVINEGHRAGLKVMAHLGNYSAQDAVLDGIDSLEHIWSVFNYIIPPDVAAQPDHRANLDLQQSAGAGPDRRARRASGAGRPHAGRVPQHDLPQRPGGDSQSSRSGARAAADARLLALVSAEQQSVAGDARRRGRRRSESTRN